MKADAVVGFVRSLGGLLRPWWRRPFGLVAVVLEVRADERGVYHRLLAPEGQAGYLVGQLRAAIPGVRVTPEEEAATLELTLAGEVGISASRSPLRVDQPASVAAALLASLQPLEAGERACFQLVVTPSAASRVRVDDEASARIGFRELLGAPPRRGKPDPVERREARQKEQEPLFLASLRLGVYAQTPERSRQLLRRLTSVLHVVRAPGAHLERRPLPSRLAARRLERARVPLLHFPLVLNGAELAALLAFPIDSPLVPGLRLGASRQLPPAHDVAVSGRVLARATFPGAERPIALSALDSLRHLQVLGLTGTGKSTLLLNLIGQDMRSGAGVVVIDPKGDLVGDVLERVPDERLDDVVVLDPADAERPVGLNLLAGGAEDAELVADQVVSIFARIFAGFWGPRTDDVLRSSILTLAEAPEPMTLAEIPLLLTDEGFRRRLVGGLDEPVGLEPFWGWYESLSPGERAQAIGPVLNKLRAFLLRRRVRNVIGQPVGLDLDRALGEGKIVLVALAKGLLGEEAAALMGSLVLARVWQAIQRRAALPASQRRPVYGFVDEFQDYVAIPTSFSDLLAQARGLGLGLTLAHQHLGQLPNVLRDAVLANARSKVVFQTSAADARLLAREFAPYLQAADLQGLGPYEIVAALSTGGRVAPPVTGVTMPPPAPIPGRAQQVRQRSRQRDGRGRTDVEAAIRRRIERPHRSAPVGRRRRG